VGRVRVACYRGHRDSLANPCCLAGEGSAPLALANKVQSRVAPMRLPPR